MKRVRAAFESYNYEVEEFLVPETFALLSLNRKIEDSVDVLNASEKMNTLLILWFYGHGGLTSKSGNDLILASHATGGTWFHWTDVAKAILQVKSDVLTFLNCCHAGASLLGEDQLEPFLQRNEPYTKEVFTECGFESLVKDAYENSLSYSLTDILAHHLDRMDLDTIRLHREATRRAKEAYTKERPFTKTPGLMSMIKGRPGSIMLHPLPDPLAPRGKKRSGSFSSTDSDNEPPNKIPATALMMS
ncbi:hypothetical protein CGCSCA4_v003291 [Colletotrichum siamense]|nr:hypothetical protein CGCSCA4_v003291 [Colletotrichum siamense]